MDDVIETVQGIILKIVLRSHFMVFDNVTLFTRGVLHSYGGGKAFSFTTNLAAVNVTVIGIMREVYWND